MSCKSLHSVWTLVWHPRKPSLGVQTLCMALLLIAATINPARADCPAAPIANPDDMAISFLAANGVQAASASLLASSVKEGTLVYDDTADKLKVCDGTNWIEVGSGSGSDTLSGLTCATNEIPKWNGTAWACAADGGGSSQWTDVTGGIEYTGDHFARIKTDHFAALALQATGTNGREYRLSSTDDANGLGGGKLVIFDETASAARLTIDATGKVGIGTITPATTALLDLTSTTQGFLPPRMTTTQRNAIASPATGLIVYNTNTNALNFWDGDSWEAVGVGAGGGVLVTGTSTTGANTTAVTNAGFQNYTSTPTLSLPSAGTYYISSHIYISYGAGCGDVFTTWSGSNIVYRSMDGKWQACGASGTANWRTHAQIVTVSAATTLTPQYSWSNPGTSGSLQFGGSNYVKLDSGGGGGGGTASADGSAGQVQFNEGGSLKADAALHWDNTNKSLGIGTATPTNSFNIVSTGFPAQFSRFSATASQGSGLELSRSRGATPGTFTAVQAGDVLGRISGRGADGAAFFEAGRLAITSDITATTGVVPGRLTLETTNSTGTLVERMRIDSAGKVGIGTTLTNDQLLAVNGGMYVDFGGQNDGTIDKSIRFGGNGSAVGIGSKQTAGGNQYGLDFYTGYSARLSVNAAGNVGIGTAAPATNLHIADTSSTGTPGLRISGTGGQVAAQLLDGNNGAGVETGILELLHEGTIGVHMNAVGPSYIASGNVGIGTTSPGAKLDVQTSVANDGLYIKGTSSSANAVLRLVNDTGSYNEITTGRSGNAGIAGKLVFTVGSGAVGNAMLIDTNGNVGIGTTSPANPLTVASGAAQFPLALGILPSTHATSRRAALAIDNWLLLQDANGDGTKNLSVYQASPGAHRMVFSPDGSIAMAYNGGNVGIGTTTPSRKLVVRDNAGNNLITFGGGTNLLRLEGSQANYSEPGLEFAEQAYAPIASIAAKNRDGGAGDLIFSTRLIGSGALSERMRIRDGGNVGIGTTTPTKNLHVVGAGGTFIAGIRLEDPHTGAGGFAQLTLRDRGPANPDDQIWDMRVGDTGKLIFGTLNNDETIFPSLVTFQRDGNVGIGTSNPGYKLDVVGNINSTGSVRIAAPSTSGTVTVCRDGTLYLTLCSSDARLKENVEPLTHRALAVISKLNPVNFTWKSDEIGKRDAGFIAQEVQPFIPEAIGTNPADGLLTFNINPIVAYSVRAIQELTAENEKLRAELKAANDNHAEAIEGLRKEIRALTAR